jgi:hypothetical protein
MPSRRECLAIYEEESMPKFIDHHPKMDISKIPPAAVQKDPIQGGGYENCN